MWSRQIGDNRKIMLDHQHGTVGRHALDQLRDAVDILMAHACGRLVEQQHFRIERERGGDFQGALATVREFDSCPVCHRGQSDVGDQLHGPFVQIVEHGRRLPKIE